MARPRKNAAKAQGSLLTPDEAAVIPVEEQPYPLPEGWKWVRLGDYNCYAGETVNPELFQGNMFELYSVPSSSFNYPEIILGKEIGSSKQSVEPDDVLLCKINPRINRVWQVTGYTNHRLIASSEWIIFRNKNILSKYMIYCMRSEYFREYMLSNVSGVGGSLMRAQPKHVRLYPIPLPPFEEQQRIVDRIESLFAKLDEAKEKAEAVLDSFESRKAAILHKAFTGELTAKWREDRGLTKESWQFLPFEKCISNMQNGISKRKGNSGRDYIVLRLTNLVNNKISIEEFNVITLDNDEIRKYSLNKNDILMIRVNGSKNNVGKQFMVEENNKYAFCDHIIRIKYDISKIDNKYAFLFSQGNYYKYYVQNNMVSSAGQNTISRKGLANLAIPLPTIPEQKEITRLLESLLEKEQQSKEAAETVLEQIDLMKKAILARAFRGELTGPVHN